jgi:hypothetical protein
MSTFGSVTEAGGMMGSTCQLFKRGPDHKYGDFRDDLVRDGFAVIKGAIPRERADKYADQMYQWIEDL